jgi:hypothetical protein
MTDISSVSWLIWTANFCSLGEGKWGFAHALVTLREDETSNYTARERCKHQPRRRTDSMSTKADIAHHEVIAFSVAGTYATHAVVLDIKGK